jgi:hypothetical protein
MYLPYLAYASMLLYFLTGMKVMDFLWARLLLLILKTELLAPVESDMISIVA